jgi:multidrug resistance efflux pump
MAFVLGVFDNGRGPLDLEAQRRGLVDSLDASSRALADAESAARDAGNAMSSTASAAGDGSHFVADLGATLRNLAASLRLSILGSQPFAGPAEDFDRVAAQAAGVAADLEQAASSVRLSSGDMGSLAGQLASMRSNVEEVKANLASLDVAGWRWLAAAILVWLAVPASVSLWLGLRWRQRERIRSAR